MDQVGGEMGVTQWDDRRVGVRCAQDWPEVDWCRGGTEAIGHCSVEGPLVTHSPESSP